MIKFINAKLNLGLNIVRKREDGYHDLETVFYPVGIYNGTPENPTPFCDILEIEPLQEEDSDIFEITGESIGGTPEDNIVVKALHIFRREYELSGKRMPAVRLILDKHLPSGAGMGGGSADGSFTLVALNELTGNSISIDKLKKMALELGADCPFFIENRPLFASGVGENFEEVDLDLTGYWALIVRTDIFISTKMAFSGITPQSSKFNLRMLGRLPIEEWKEVVVNDFETSIFRQYPELKSVKESLYINGALYASMSGSGSTIFGIFPSETEALAASGNFNQKCYLCKL